MQNLEEEGIVTSDRKMKRGGGILFEDFFKLMFSYVTFLQLLTSSHASTNNANQRCPGLMLVHCPYCSPGCTLHGGKGDGQSRSQGL